MAKLDTDVRNLINHREFVIQADAQMKQLPTVEFVFGYPMTNRPRQKGEPRPCFLAMPTKSWLPDVQRVIASAANGFVCRLSVDNAAPGNIMNQVWQDIRTGAVPFDVRNYKYGEYETQNLGPLQAWPVDAFRAVPQRYRFDPAPPSGT